MTLLEIVTRLAELHCPTHDYAGCGCALGQLQDEARTAIAKATGA